MSARRAVHTDTSPVVDQSCTFTVPKPSVLERTAVQYSWYSLDPKIHTGPNPCVEVQQKHMPPSLLGWLEVKKKRSQGADLFAKK